MPKHEKADWPPHAKYTERVSIMLACKSDVTILIPEFTSAVLAEIFKGFNSSLDTVELTDLTARFISGDVQFLFHQLDCSMRMSIQICAVKEARKKVLECLQTILKIINRQCPLEIQLSVHYCDPSLPASDVSSVSLKAVIEARQRGDLNVFINNTPVEFLDLCCLIKSSL